MIANTPLCTGMVGVYANSRVLAGVAAVAQLVECVLGKDEVKGSIPFSSFVSWVRLYLGFG